MSAAQDVENLPVKYRRQFVGLVEELETVTGAELLDQRLKEGWTLERIKLE